MAVLLALYRFPRYYNRRVRNPGSQRRCLIFIIRIGFPKAKASTNSSRGAGVCFCFLIFLFFIFSGGKPSFTSSPLFRILLLVKNQLGIIIMPLKVPEIEREKLREKEEYLYLWVYAGKVSRIKVGCCTRWQQKLASHSFSKSGTLPPKRGPFPSHCIYICILWCVDMLSRQV